MSNMDKPPKPLQPQCLDQYGIKPCTAEYLERMRFVCRQNCYDIKKLFEEHDPLEFGSVSDYLFKCVMHEKFMCQTNFSMEIIQLISDFFRLPDGNICYMRLHYLMKSDDNIADQLRECASQVPFPDVSCAPLRSCGKRVFGTDPCVPAILERMRTAYWRLRVKITDLFRCCDTECKGLVPEEKFRCIMNETIWPEAGLTERQLDAIANYYRAYDDKIDYKRMSEMFESTLSIQEQIQLNYITSREQLKKPKPVNFLEEEQEERIKEVLYKIVKRADRHILTTLNSIFEKFAHRQSGETTVPHLRRFFYYLDADLAESDFALVCKKYATKDYTVNFLQIVEDLDDTYHSRICPQPPPKPILGADGPEDLDYPPFGEGAGKNSSVWAHGECPCASEDEHAAGACLPPDSSRFYIGGTVSGGIGRAPVMGKDYVHKRLNAGLGQRYSGAYGLSPAAGKRTAMPVGFTGESKPKPGQSESVELRGLMERMQQYLYRYRVRCKDFFKDFDPLNHGFVSANRFRRALTSMGFGLNGRLGLTEGELDALINFYRLSEDPSMVCWRKFDDDIESIFIQKGIEKLPAILTPSPGRILGLPNVGATNMEDIPLRIRQLAKCAVARLRSRVQIECCNIKYFFQGFDRSNTGYVSRQQFKQTLSMLNYYFTAEELDAMSVQYGDAKGFNYLKLLKDIEPTSDEPGWYSKYKTGRLYQLNRPPQEPKWQEHDLQRVMYKIQARMVRNRPKLRDFLRDHDMFSHDRIKEIDFHRALDRAGFELTPREVEVLTCCFRCPDDPSEIEWRCFLNSIETVFTVANLEKAPRIEPQAWKPLREMDYDKQLSDTEHCLYNDGMRRLAQKVANRRLEFKPMFADFDKPQCGLVSVNQFHRVLHTLGLASIVTTSELEAIIKRFSVIRGGKTDVDYVEFLAQLDALTYVDPITLEEMSPTGVEWYKRMNPCC
ncbi:unnamed protein product [Orchesella dallaii]|uniref:EF-hand domain-containing protein n=1 Tax=Orchesella dallaii TaxID=48710 RepID=A0ABP1QP29_9HEXA